MKQKNLTPSEQLAVLIFDDYGVLACNGFMYNCKVVINSSQSDFDIDCITWSGMN